MAELKKCNCGKEPIKVTRQHGKEIAYAYTCTCGGLLVYDWSPTIEEAKEKWNKREGEQ